MEPIHQLPFQFSPLREGRHNSQALIEDSQTFQFSPLREGRPGILGKTIQNNAISILAPARGATLWQKRRVLRQTLFQFSPLREGRLPCRIPAMCDNRVYFNSRPCERGDQVLNGVDWGYYPISILAPARGATSSSEKERLSPSFQFSPLREGRHRAFNQSANHANFNSRPCERGDAGRKGNSFSFFYFNSRPCERGDGCTGISGCEGVRFQFSPLREGRPEGLPGSSV